MSGLGGSPLGGAPLGALTTDSVSDSWYLLSDTISAADALLDYLNGQIPMDLVTSAALTDATANNLLFNLRERLSLVDVVTNQATLHPNLSDRVSMVDAIRLAWWMLLQDSADASDLSVGTVTKIMALADAMLATATADGKLTAYVACAVAATMEDAIRGGWVKDLADQAAITDAVQAKLAAILSLNDSVALSDSASGSLRLSLICAESVQLQDTLAANLFLNADLSDQVLAYVAFRLGDTEYRGWAMNTDLRAVTEHRNQPFDSVVSHPKGFHYAAGPNGIVQITGKDDDGEPIDAYFRTFLTDFGTHKFKRVPDVYMGLATDGRMLVKMVTRDPSTGAVTDDWYELVTKQDGNEAQGRAKVGRGLKSTWWGMELRNIDGADFRVDEVALRAVVLDRRQ